MCGIAGYFGSKMLGTSAVEQTLALMKRRGPNGQKYEKIVVNDSKACHFLHSRLSIIDLELRSDQPFHFNGKTIIYNGEIYNYLEVREELIKLGHQFVTRSDTEVLIHALDQWGVEALKKCEGMWAFALYDQKEKTLMLARDPFGEKPLYIYEPEPGEIYFGSEIKYLTRLLNKEFKINDQKITLFMANGYKSLFKNEETFFKEVKHFPAATVRIYTQNGFKDILYWKKSFNEEFDLSIEQAIDHIRTLIIKSVEMKLRSDVPLAFCLSGGVDSNSIISIAKKILNYDVHAFSVLSADEKYDEKEDILYAVKELGLDHTYINVSNDNFLDNLKEMVKYHSAPITTLTYYMNWQLYREMSEKNFKVSVMGTGGDEIFSGYYDHYNFYLADIKKEKSLYQTSLQNWNTYIKDIVRNPYLSDPEIFVKNPELRDHIYLNNEKYSKSLKLNHDISFVENDYARNSLLKNRMLNELLSETVPVSLNQDDLNCMHFSIENRSPFLSRELVEFIQQLPVSFYVQHGYAKYLLRKSMEGIVPDRIIKRRKKLGLNTSVKRLIDDNHDFRKSILQDSPIYSYVNRDYISQLLDQHDLPNSDSKFLFSFLSTKEFLEQNI